MSLPALPLGGRGLEREPQPGRTDLGVSGVARAARPPSRPTASVRASRRPRRPCSPAVPATAAGRRPGVACWSPWQGDSRASAQQFRVSGRRPCARREPGGGRLRRGRRGDEASRAADVRVPGGEQNGRSVLPPGPRGLQEELLTRQCGQPVTLALSALQSRAQVRGPRDSGREHFTFFGCCLVF